MNTKPFVMVRTLSAGVHMGYLLSREGMVVMLAESRRLWRWAGGNTLNEVSVHGCDMKHSRISESVEQITLTQAVEIIPCTPLAQENLCISRWPIDAT